MARLHIYADESGNFNFSRAPGASRYFILATVVLADHAIETALHELRRDLVWRGFDLSPSGDFHATEDSQAIRNEVFRALSQHEFRIDATILEKPKARPRARTTEEGFYKTAWFFHMQHALPAIATSTDRLLVVAASLGFGAKRRAFEAAVREAVSEHAGAGEHHVACWPAATDPCLQVADYCCWAIKRKWENRDERSYGLIADKISSEFDLFHKGKHLYY
jgi:hypothetical protein